MVYPQIPIRGYRENHALIIFKLDYCNALYVNLPDKLIAKLQSVLHDAARLVTRTTRSEHITPALIRLHWLSIKERIECKVISTVFKGVHGEAPEYISELLHPYEPSSKPRSSTQNLLHEPRYRLKSAGYRCFEVAGPTLWNRLPPNICSINSFNVFKKALKTYLFKRSYGV